jgi:short-subunit dehydrogenase
MQKPVNILISGASGGIGSSLAISYAATGVNLFLCARNSEKLNEIKNVCQKLGANILTKNFDITNEESAAEFVREIEKFHEIDLVIANAGISGGMIGSDETFFQTKQIIATNINGVMNLVHPVIEKMKQRQKGQIAIVSSLAGFMGIPSSPAYSASKAAIRLYAESLRGNLSQYGIEVNAVCPGYVATDMTKKNNFWMPFLISQEKAAKIIKKGLEKNRSRIAFPLAVYLPLCFSALLPRILIDFLFAKIAKKNNRQKL